MGLRERIESLRVQNSKEQSSSNGEAARTGSPRSRSLYERIKFGLHRKLIEHIGSDRISIVDSPSTRREIQMLLERLLAEENPPLNQEERRRLIHDLEDETFGLGPLEPLLQDPTINDILVNRFDEVFVERYGRLERSPVLFRDEAHLLRVIERIVSQAGRRIDESSPMVDARLRGGSRVNAIIPPLAVDGPVISIRRYRKDPLLMDDLTRFGTLNQTAMQLLELAVKAKANILVSGGTGSGKTTLLNVMIRYISAAERVVSIEDTVELRLGGLHFVRMETRPPNVEGRGEVTQRDLLKNALRMRPDRILIGEVRGGEALDMLQAMNTGHPGSLTTIHANTPQDALSRLETMILLAGENLTVEAMRRQISSAVHLILQLERFPDGSRRLVSFCEIAGMHDGTIQLREILKFQPTGSGAGGIQGEFVTSGVIPAFFKEYQDIGGQIPPSLLAELKKGKD